MNANDWKEILDEQKRKIIQIQQDLNNATIQEYESQASALHAAIAVYRDINEEYQESLAIEAQIPLASTEAMSAAAYLAHYEHLVTDGNGELESWYDLKKWEQEGWGKVASAVIAHYEPTVIAEDTQEPTTKHRTPDLITNVAIACFLARHKSLSLPWDKSHWDRLSVSEQMAWIPIAKAAIATFESNGDWKKALSKIGC